MLVLAALNAIVHWKKFEAVKSMALGLPVIGPVLLSQMTVDVPVLEAFRFIAKQPFALAAELAPAVVVTILHGPVSRIALLEIVTLPSAGDVIEINVATFPLVH